MQLQQTNSPFTQEQIDLFNKVLPTLTPAQQIWLSGYLASQQGLLAPSTPPTTVNREVQILFASQSGNSERLAKQLSQKLEGNHYVVRCSAMRDFKTNHLRKVKTLVVIASTHGEGVPPDNGKSFYDFLHSTNAPQLSGLQYAVLALGDTAYEFFCKTGKDFDLRLEQLGGTRIIPRIDCDLDYDEPAAQWMEQLINELDKTSGKNKQADNSLYPSAPNTVQPTYSRSSPFQATVLTNINLNGRGSDQETRHLVLSLQDSNLNYETGDCVGIYPENHPSLVDSILDFLAWNPNELVIINKHNDQQTIRVALLKHFEITVITKSLLSQLVSFTANPQLHDLLNIEHEQRLKDYLLHNDLLDLLQDFAPWDVTPQQLISLLRKLPSRLYSISSSYRANPDEVHLTIRTVRYTQRGRDRYGVCSTQCAERLKPGDTVPIYIHPNSNFKLPDAHDAPIIMIGPGTGVAPFRAFMEEREELGATGKTWLFFGDRHFLTDFLYQAEWLRWHKQGLLTRLDVAFSRDTPEKVYVQHRMMQHSRELYTWIQDGAYIYVCGDEKRMAHDVHRTLIEIFKREGNMTESQAESSVLNLQEVKRYQRDVY